MIEHAKETQPVAAEPASAEPVGNFVAGVCALPVQCCGDRSDEAGTCGTGKGSFSANGTGASPARDAVRGTGRIAAVASIGYVGATRNSPAITGSSLSAYAAKPAPPLTVVMPDVPNFNVNVTGGITPTSR